MKKNKLIGQIFAIAIILILLATALSLTDTLAVAGDKQEVHLPTIEESLNSNPKLESVLNQLVDAGQAKGPAAVSTFAEQRAVDLVDNRVRVVIEAMPDEADAAREAAIASGADVQASYENLLSVLVPVSTLNELASNPSIRFVRLPWRSEPQVISEGAGVINADDWQSAGFTGDGVKIGIIDQGFSGYTGLMGTELPPSITTHWFNNSGTAGTEIHGTACAEIIHDIAPGANLYFTNYSDEVGWGNAVNWLIAQDVDVISCSILWFNGPGDGTGLICDTVADARNAGILWVNSAGNYAQRHWMGNWVDTDSDTWLDFVPYDGTNDIYASAYTTMTIILKWDDTWGHSDNDYALYLYTPSFTNYVVSDTKQNGDDDPVEIISAYGSRSGYYHIKIKRYDADGSAKFHLFTFYQDLEHRVVSNSLSQPADSPVAMTVGAVSWDSPSVLETFSSQGPTDDGRTKPDLVGPDYVSTATYGLGNFPGTSASAPHAAGAAALVKQAHPSYTPSQIQAFLEGEAVDLGVLGKDNLYGAGRLNLQLAPSVTTNDAGNITTSSATLNGNLTGKGTASSVNVSFQYATDAYYTSHGNTYDNETSVQSKSVIGLYNSPISSLTPSTTYHFRAKAVGNGTAYGNDTAFTTSTTTPTVAFSSATYSVVENLGPATITVNLSGASAQTVTVNYATSNGNATAGSDYTAASGTLTFNPGNTTKTFNITILDDVIFEGPETVNLALSSPGNATLGSPNPAVLTITDNEPQPTVAFFSAPYSVAENAATKTITVNLSGVSAQTVTVNYATSDGNATAGSDYTAASGTLTFNPGNTTQTFNITILDDALMEGDETVNLALSSPVKATLGSPSTAVLTITDNETQPLTPVTGITREVNCDMLPSVSITLDGTGPVVSDQAGQFQIMATSTGNHTIVAHKDGFRDKTQNINIAGLGQEFAVTCNFQGNQGLIPNAPGGMYVGKCVNLWLFTPNNPVCALESWTVAKVKNAWLFPVNPAPTPTPTPTPSPSPSPSPSPTPQFVSLGEALDNTDLAWTTGGDADWFGQTAISYYDGDAAQTGIIGDNQSTWLRTTVVGTGTLTFRWYISSEMGHDCLEFSYQDDAGFHSVKISGIGGWSQESPYVQGAGSHVLEWKYYKDGSGSGGEDKGWVDKVTWSGGIP